MATQHLQLRLSAGIATSSTPLICCSTQWRSSSSSLSAGCGVAQSPNSLFRLGRLSGIERLKYLSTPRTNERRSREAGGVARAAFFQFGRSVKDKDKTKMKLLTAIAPLARGSNATPDDVAVVDQIARELEKLNPTKEPLNSELLSGKWKLIYTTSEEVLKKSWPEILRPNGPIYQAINTDTLRAQNLETWPFYNQVTANLEPVSGSKVVVKFDFFKIAGLFPISKGLKFPVGASHPTSKSKCSMDTHFDDSLPVVGGGDTKESNKEDFGSPDHKQPFDNSEGMEQNSLYDHNLKWCGLCGSGNGWMMCGRCMGEGAYATRPGLAGAKGKVGWARCKTCFGCKIVPCPLCVSK